MIRKRTVTMTNVGADGSSASTYQLNLGRPGFVRAIKVDYGAGEAATADLTIKADNSSGVTLFTKANNATDIAATPVAMPGMDEGGAATAATDVGSGGFPFSSGLYFAIAQGDLGEVTVIDLWLET